MPGLATDVLAVVDSHVTDADQAAIFGDQRPDGVLARHGHTLKRSLATRIPFHLLRQSRQMREQFALANRPSIEAERAEKDVHAATSGRRTKRLTTSADSVTASPSISTHAC